MCGFPARIPLLGTIHVNALRPNDLKSIVI